MTSQRLIRFAVNIGGALLQWWSAVVTIFLLFPVISGMQLAQQSPSQSVSQAHMIVKGRAWHQLHSLQQALVRLQAGALHKPARWLRRVLGSRAPLASEPTPMPRPH